MKTILAEMDMEPITVRPGDIMVLKYNDEEVLRHEFNIMDGVDYTVFDRAVIFRVRNELGLKDGIGGAFGKKRRGKAPRRGGTA